MDNLAQSAIEASLAGNFVKAIVINKNILKKNKKDIEALNRLGCAYFEIGEINKAKRAYRKGLLCDKCNPIIIKNLKKIAEFKGKLKNFTGFHLNPKELFLTEPGRTKITPLVNLSPANNFLSLTPGTPVSLIIKKRSILVYLDPNGDLTKKPKKRVYLGAIPDDLSFRLLRMIKAGNLYQAYIRNIVKNNLTIFIKEVYKAKKFINQPSFPESFSQPSVNNNLNQ